MCHKNNCIHNNNPRIVTGVIALDGHSRINRFPGIVDMGAYETIYNGTFYSIP